VAAQKHATWKSAGRVLLNRSNLVLLVRQQEVSTFKGGTTNMKYPTLDAVERLSLAHEQVLQLRRTLDSLSEVLPEMHESWCYLIHDVDCMQRRLGGALEAIGKVFQQDPAEYIRPPRWE